MDINVVQEKVTHIIQTIRNKFVVRSLRVCTAVQLIAYVYFGHWITTHEVEFHSFEEYGILLTLAFHLLRVPIYLSAPFNLFNVLGFVFYNPFEKVRIPCASSSCSEFVCFRVVTKGLYPELVKANVNRNVGTCQKCGIQNYKFEVVTDNKINLPKCHETREIVVPSAYKTPNGTLFKARALNYCLEREVNIYANDDWIVHLDEETILTTDAVLGILEFITKGKCNIGQGAISYATDVVNWFTTLADGVRVFIDYTVMKVCLCFFHRPFFGFKGSFIVVKMAVEQEIGFDFGPYCSIAEDLYFALKAWSKGYTFDFINGEMQEKSTFSIKDFIKQRRRWFIGHFHVLWNSDIPPCYKMAIYSTNISSLFMWTTVIFPTVNSHFPLYVPSFCQWTLAWIFGITPFVYFVGNFLQLRSSKRAGVLGPLAIAFMSQILVPVFGILEAYAALSGFIQRNHLTFEIVRKETFKKMTSQNGHLQLPEEII